MFQRRNQLTFDQIFLKKTKEYLQKDNPVRKDPLNKFFDKLPFQDGNKGRLQAQAYYNRMQYYVGDSLLEKVFLDLYHKSNQLNFCDKYKNKLLEGFCEYFNCLTKIENKVRTSMPISHGVMYGGGPYVENDNLKTELMMNEVTDIMNKVYFRGENEILDNAFSFYNRL